MSLVRAPSARRGRGKAFALSLRPLGGVVLAIAAYGVAHAVGLLPQKSTPSLAELAGSWAQGIADLSLVTASLSTLQATAQGLLIAFLIGVPIGFANGLLRSVDRLTGVAVEFMRPVPAVALIPVAIVLFGTGISMQVFLVVTACVWPLMISAKQAVQSIEPLWPQVARVSGHGRASGLLRVVLPASIPGLITGLRTSAAIGLIVAVAGGLLTGSPGLGASLATAQNKADAAAAFAAMVMAGLLGMGIDYALRRLERGVSGWQIAVTEGKR